MNKKFIVLFVSLILISGSFLVSSFGKSDKVSGNVYDALEENDEVRVIVKLKEVEEERGFFVKTVKSGEEIEIEKKEAKEDVLEEIGIENVKHVFDKTIAIEVNEDGLKDLERNDDVESVVIDKKIFAHLQGSVPYVNASLVWPVNLSSQNITGINETICIIDTGINYSHPDLSAKYLGGYDFVNDDTDPLDDNGHGTHVAGIAAAIGTINGVAIGANIIAIKVLDSSGGGFNSDLEAGIDWCVDNASLFNISVISMSLGDCSNHSTYCNSDGTADNINNAIANNISVIAAAGNGPGGSCSGITNINGPSSPACVENATAIGTINDANEAISFQRGVLFELMAPGVSINSTMIPNPGGDILAACGTGTSYCSLSGTSMAAPHVAGAFALFRQFFRLQNGRVPTPNEIRTEFNSTGKRINDTSGTNLNYTIIDVFAAIQSIDTSNPVVSLLSPLNNTTQFTQNVTLNCSANDVQLDNITLYVWNSSGDVYNNSEVGDVSGTNGYLEVNITNMSYDSYKWNCLAYDENNNFSFASSNYSLTIGQMVTSLNLPSDNNFVSTNQTYNCSAETEPTKLLSNITFYVWNSTGYLVYNSSENVNGTTNSSLFYFNFTTEQEYSWNCLSYNNESESDWGDTNYSITYDVTIPNLTIVSSPGDATSNSISRSFGFNVSDTNLANCSLIVNGTINLTNSSMNQSINQTFSKTFTPGTYTWKINCSDFAGNVNSSSANSFTITAESSGNTNTGSTSTSSTSSSPAAATPAEPAVYNVSVSEVSKGYTQSLKKDEKINFSIYDLEGGRHLLTVDEVGVDYVNITIESNPVNLTLGVGQSVRLNLTSPNYYDLFIKLNNITNGSAELTIQLINEPIEAVVVTEKEIVKDRFLEGKDYFWVVIVLVVVLAVVVFVVIRKNRWGKYEKKLVKRELKLRKKGDMKRDREKKKIKRKKAKKKNGARRVPRYKGKK